MINPIASTLTCLVRIEQCSISYKWRRKSKSLMREMVVSFSRGERREGSEN